MYSWGLPLGCFFIVAAAGTGIFALQWLDGIAIRVGVGIAALLAYAAVMCVHYFELASSPVNQGPAKNPDGQRKP